MTKSWKKRLLLLGILILLLATAFFLGPKPNMETAIIPVSLPENLDAYLVNKESQFEDIVPNTEKTIIWAREDPSRTPVSIVYLHGFSATRQETVPLCDNLAKVLGANLFYTRYRGHGRTGEALARASVNDWLNDTMEALEIGKRIGEKVIIVGTSTGGTLATWLAQQPVNGDVLAYILISPNYGLFDKRSEIITYPWGTALVKLLVDEEYAYEPVNEASAMYWTCRYPSVALVTMVALVKHVRKAGFEQVKTPVLVLYSPDDQTVDPMRTEEYFPRFGSSIKELRKVEDIRCPDNHVLAGNMRAPECTQLIRDIILDFLSRLD